MYTLLIVESPVKAKAIAGFAGAGHIARATFGHFRDLPPKELGVDVEDGSFRPHYRIANSKTVKVLRQAIARADTVVLACDPDREGEAIAWHVVQALKNDLKGKRVVRAVFHEITPRAVREGLASPREIDQHLVNAQQARRVLDRLVGYKISPILWKDFSPQGQRCPPGLSAGRVQSVALRLVTEREREIRLFEPEEYWTLDAQLSPANDLTARFLARLAKIGAEKASLKDKQAAEDVVADLAGDQGWKVKDIKRSKDSRSPYPPYTTSTLQQDASARLGWPPKKTMQIAQQLFEGMELPGEGHTGLITYMRTDSVHLAPEAQAEAREVIERFWAHALPEAPPRYQTKTANAQEAHEAIRPTSALRFPKHVTPALSAEQARLYELVWKRFISSQMKAAVYLVTTVDAEAAGLSKQKYLFRASGRKVIEPGYLLVYEEDPDQGGPIDSSSAQSDGKDVLSRLALQRGQELLCHQLLPEQHFTEPPTRFSEAGLVKELESRGVGRPSTYASILATLHERGYVERQGRKALMPTPLGDQVCEFLLQRFPDVFDVSFTARMEAQLDEIASGSVRWQQVMRDFWKILGPRVS